MSLAASLEEKRLLVEGFLRSSLPSPFSSTLWEAMGYSLFAGGKRIRPVLTLAACEAVGGKKEEVLPAACAIEMVHTMSLIHDDLPCMDNDDYRRGKLTNHKVYGEAQALLAGDALLAYAFEIMAVTPASVPSSRIVEAMALLARASAAEGMMGGQSVDLLSEGKTLSLEALQALHRMKTGALLKASILCGGILGGASPTEMTALTRFADEAGISFQIVDDILDVTGSREELGKSPGKDVQSQKATYPALLGLEGAKAAAKEHLRSALDALDPLGNRGDELKAIARYIVERRS